MNETFKCKFNDDMYLVADKVCSEYINSGRAEPYSGNINIVKQLCKKRNNTYLDIGANMGTHRSVF